MFEIVQIVLFLLLGFVVTGGVFRVIHWNINSRYKDK